MCSDRPSPPQNLRVTEVYKDFITVTWDIPESDGGSPITGYLVERKSSTKQTWIRVGETDAKTLTIKATKLTEGHEYLFKAYAINEIGQSDPAETPEPTMAKLPFDPPGPPINLKASDVDKSSATITWAPPEFDGGSPVTGYYVEKLSGTRWIKVNKKPVKKCELQMDDLIEGETYEVRVMAENEAGIGKPCDSIRFVAKDPFDKPGQPGQPQVSNLTAESCDLTWAPPEDDGGAPITHYIVEKRKVGDIKWTKLPDQPEECKFTVPGLTEETEYEFRVTAVNKAGEGPPSVPSEPCKFGKQMLLILLFILHKIY